MKKPFRLGLFGQILIAIGCGVGLGFLCMHGGGAGDVCVRVLKTFNALFSQLLKFIVPLLIFGLVIPAIADVGKGAGKMLLAVMVASYCSTVIAALFGYFCASELLPHYIAQGAMASAGNGKVFEPFFNIKIPPLCDVLTALAIAFMVGVGIVFTGAEHLRRSANDFGAIVKLTIMRVIIPGLPVYIFTMICEMTASGKFGATAGTMCKVIGTGWGLTICYLFVIYSLAGAVARKNPLKCLWNMVSAYFTGLSIASSSAVIPVTLECCRKNGISDDIRNFVVPLCANVHMPGSAVKLLTSFVSISIIYGQAFDFALVVNFILMMAIAAVAAPGVMGGVLMASIGLLDSILGFAPEQTALLTTFYLALDGYGPATNVTSDGAIALMADRWFGKRDF